MAASVQIPKPPSNGAARPRTAEKPQRASPGETVLDPIITMNGGGIIQSASDSVEQVFGWTPMELFGRNIKVLIPEPRRSALDRYLDRYRHADSTKSLERTRRFDAVRKDGRLIQIDLSMSRADLPQQGASYFIGIIRDVSHQIDVAPDSSVERTRLQRLLIEQTRALATANLRLQLADRLASLGTLAAGLGHDMNNVLLPVRARLTALEHAGINSAALEHVSAVQRSIAYLQQLSESLHFLATDPDGTRELQDGNGSTDIADWWSHVGVLLKSAIPGRIRLVTSFPPGLPAVNIAPHWLTQAVLNLMINAGEAISEHQRGARVTVWAELVADDTLVHLCVKDNGRGMSPSTLRRSTDLFFTTKSRTMGTGLGLPLARKVAMRAGGDVEIQSEPGKGTTVTLVLPVSPVAPTSTVADKVKLPHTARISIKDGRTTALLTHVLVKAGFRLRPPSSRGPGSVDLWVTEPTKEALVHATRLRVRGRGPVTVVLGPPSARSRAAWATTNARIIEHADDFEAIRHVLSVAILSI